MRLPAMPGCKLSLSCFWAPSKAVACRMISAIFGGLFHGLCKLLCLPGMPVQVSTICTDEHTVRGSFVSYKH